VRLSHCSIGNFQPSSCHLSLSAVSRCALDETYQHTIDPAASSNGEWVLRGPCSTRVMIIRFHLLSALCASLLREERYAGSVCFQRQRPYYSVEIFSKTFSWVLERDFGEWPAHSHVCTHMWSACRCVTTRVPPAALQLHEQVGKNVRGNYESYSPKKS
jgi:hypothetical protein